MEKNKTRFEQLCALRIQYGWDGKQKPKKWSEKMLAGRRTEGHPRNLQVIKTITQRFPDEFAWEINNGEIKFVNYPTVEGKNPTLFDLLIMPEELTDRYNDQKQGLPRTMHIGETSENFWVVKVMDQPKIFPQRATNQAINLIQRWQEAFPREKTFVQENFGVPSLLVRIDCVVSNTEDIGVYEIEERPAGVGITLLNNAQFKERFLRLKNIWPAFKAVVSSKRSHKGDDYLWLERVSLEQAVEDKTLVMVRAEPKEKEFYSLQSQSVSTIACKGLKSYGLALSFWTLIASGQKLPWQDGFCLKPLQGSKLRDVRIWDPEGYGESTKQEILETLENQKTMYLQPLIPPMRWDINGREYDGVYRVFFGFDPKTQSWVPLGGMWNARPAPCFKIHGTSETIEGPAILPF